MTMPSSISISYTQRVDKKLSVHRVALNVPTGQGGWRMRARDAAHALARTIPGIDMWAIPYLVVEQPGAWLIYGNASSNVPLFGRRMPTLESAEMWMLHRADE